MIKKAMTIVFLAMLLTACGTQVDYKDIDDRKDFSENEIHAVETEILNLDNVASFEVKHIESGIYAVLEVEEPGGIHELVEQAFYAIKKETTDEIIFYVKQAGEEKSVLAEVFKPRNVDNEDKWTIFYD